MTTNAILVSIFTKDNLVFSNLVTVKNNDDIDSVKNQLEKSKVDGAINDYDVKNLGVIIVDDIFINGVDA